MEKRQDNQSTQRADTPVTVARLAFVASEDTEGSFQVDVPSPVPAGMFDGEQLDVICSAVLPPVDTEIEWEHLGQELQLQVGCLIKSMERLQRQNQHLLDENRHLREEVTLTRLRRDLGLSTDDLIRIEAVVPAEASHLFSSLPDRFSFSDFFEVAESAGLSPETGRDYLLRFIEHELVCQDGALLEKNGTLNARPF